jgi:hypothetical protein
MRQWVGDLERGDLPAFETADGHSGWRVGAHQFAAFASCARQLNVDVEVVMRAAGTGKLAALIEARGGRRTVSRRAVLRGQLARTDMLLRRHELMRKQIPPW